MYITSIHNHNPQARENVDWERQKPCSENEAQHFAVSAAIELRNLSLKRCRDVGFLFSEVKVFTIAFTGFFVFPDNSQATKNVK